MRNNKRIIYTSSYDRGLEHLLEMWADIRKTIPDAELEIFYGWQLFDKFYSGNPASMAWKAKIVELMGQEGIIKHGRLSQTELEEEMKTCGIWAYPTHFGEINCISALKAQAYGCEPVVINYGALQETVQFGRKVAGDIYDDETKEEFKKQLIDALQNPMSDEKREEMMQTTQEKYNWGKLASDWTEVFKNG